ncbi:ribonuclease H-like domain-containing protein, partial [Sphaerosporella brunnea]
IHVDGACVNNGSSTARASAGVCFGENSQYNWAGVLDSNKHPQTNQSAELFAALRALRIVKLHRVAGHKVWRKARKVIIITDSAYVVNGTTKWINGWKNNGFINSKGASVVNARKFKQLDALISELELEGVEVLFWRVDRQYNQDADRLA